MTIDDAELLAYTLENYPDLSKIDMSPNRLLAALKSCQKAGHLDADYNVTASFLEKFENVVRTDETLTKIIWKNFR